MDAFLYVGLPYLSLTILVVGTIVRFRQAPFSVSSLSSQVLERKKLALGTVPWHLGILVLLAGHLVAFLVPDIWRSLTANHAFLLTVEVIGFAAAAMAAFGLGTLVYRRLVTARLQAVTNRMDLVVLGLLLVQVLVGISVALSARWGAQWSAGTTSPYLWSLLTFQPDLTYVADLPPSVRLHLGLAWLTFALIPFTRLIHGFSIPLGYLVRAPQQVIWATRRRLARDTARAGGVSPETSRRHFVKGLGGLFAAGVLMSVGVLDKLVGYFKGQRLERSEQVDLLEKKLERLRATSEEQALELERLEKDAILVAQLGQLDPRQGRYFIDYQMRPALAFKGADQLPILISAKCTHLGCTVASDVNDKGQILCPCHISYFDIKTGAPNPGAPAKAPLPRIGWLLKDTKGTVVMTQDGAGNRTWPEGEDAIAPDALDGLQVWIAKRFEEGA
ncbi:MAG: respiratory nitrate reductase subunit gamma [Deltaproteobacteria bacterium]|nr:MAG: respiratory nitrate reductase subunit gamma [Deltaproteobacteria bacterium]